MLRLVNNYQKLSKISLFEVIVIKSLIYVYRFWMLLLCMSVWFDDRNYLEVYLQEIYINQAHKARSANSIQKYLVLLIVLLPLHKIVVNCG